MNLQLTTAHFELTDKIKQQIQNKLEAGLDRLLSKFNEEMKTADLHIDRLSSGEYKATLDMLLPGKKQIYAQKTHKILTSSLTGLRQQVEKQIEKYKADLTPYTSG